jgi:hypothetical protein
VKPKRGRLWPCEAWSGKPRKGRCPAMVPKGTRRLTGEAGRRARQLRCQVSEGERLGSRLPHRPEREALRQSPPSHRQHLWQCDCSSSPCYIPHPDLIRRRLVDLCSGTISSYSQRLPVFSWLLICAKFPMNRSSTIRRYW